MVSLVVINHGSQAVNEWTWQNTHTPLSTMISACRALKSGKKRKLISRLQRVSMFRMLMRCRLHASIIKQNRALRHVVSMIMLLSPSTAVHSSLLVRFWFYRSQILNKQFWDVASSYVRHVHRWVNWIIAMVISICIPSAAIYVMSCFLKPWSLNKTVMIACVMYIGIPWEQIPWKTNNWS